MSAGLGRESGKRYVLKAPQVILMCSHVCQPLLAYFGHTFGVGEISF